MRIAPARLALVLAGLLAATAAVAGQREDTRANDAVRVERQIQSIPEFTECDKITGEDCFVARLHVRSMEQLDELLDRINVYAETNTSIVKKTSVPRRLPPMN